MRCAKNLLADGRHILSRNPAQYLVVHIAYNRRLCPCELFHEASVHAKVQVKLADAMVLSAKEQTNMNTGRIQALK